MNYFAFLVMTVVSALIRAELLLLLVRAILSWVMPGPDSPIWRLVVSFTEPVIYPIRQILNRFPFVRECPVDLSFLAAVLLLQAVQMILG